MFTEDRAVFFADFGLPCAKGGIQFIGILDRPDESLAMGGTAMLSTMYELTVDIVDVGRANLVSGDVITVSGVAYSVRALVAQSDGQIVVVTLSKV